MHRQGKEMCLSPLLLFFVVVVVASVNTDCLLTHIQEKNSVRKRFTMTYTVLYVLSRNLTQQTQRKMQPEHHNCHIIDTVTVHNESLFK